MFSNDVKTALENAIIDFNISVQTKTYRLTDYDLKNMFFQYLKKNLKSTEYFQVVNYLEFKCITKFKIINGSLIQLEFACWNTYNKKVNELFEELNKIILSLDFNTLTNKSITVNNISNTFDNFINQLHNIKVK